MRNRLPNHVHCLSCLAKLIRTVSLREDRLREVKGLLLDLEGTLYTNAGPIEGAPEALHRIYQSGVPYRYVTNATHKPRWEVVLYLRKMGFPVEESHILTPYRKVVPESRGIRLRPPRRSAGTRILAGLALPLRSARRR